MAKKKITKAEEPASDTDLAWQTELRNKLESAFEKTKVSFIPKVLYQDQGLPQEETVFDIRIITPAFDDLDYEERINMIWPIFVKIPDTIYKKIRFLDCQTPNEHHRKVA